MHTFEIPPSTIQRLGAADWWALTLADLERMAVTLLGPLPGGWVRQGDNFVRVGNVKYGSDARRLGAELAALSTEAKRILTAGHPEAALRAAAFYHLRFENIHPLVEGNGRIGRVILAAQLDQACHLPTEEILRSLRDAQRDYARVFVTNNPPVMFELMVDLVARISGIVPSPDASQVPGSLEPLHPQKSVPKNAPRLHPEAFLKNPALLKSKAAKPNGP